MVVVVLRPPLNVAEGSFTSKSGRQRNILIKVSDARVLLLFFLLKQLVIDVLVAIVVVVALSEAIKLTENLNEQMANKL